MQVLEAADGERLVVVVEERHVGAVGPHVAQAVDVGHQFGELEGADGVGGLEDAAWRAAPSTRLAWAKRADEGQVGQAHLAGPVGGQGDAGVRAARA